MRYVHVVGIHVDDVRRVAALARLYLEATEEQRLCAELGAILEAFERLQRLDTAGVEPTAHVEEFAAPLRADEVTNLPADEALLAGAPARDGRRFRVPKIIE